MKRGIVVATHPEDHSVDIVMSDGRRLAGVQVMSKNGSARSGSIDMPAVPPKDGDKWDITKENGQDQIALVDFVGEVPIVVGYLFPQISQMTFEDPEFRFDRHQSDVITTIDGKGNIQLAHPSGTYVRIGEDPDMVDYAGKNIDETLAVDRNTDKQVNVRIGMANGVMTLTIAPDGTVTLVTESSVNIEASEMNIELESTLNVTAPESINFDTPELNVTGNVNVGGNVAVEGEVEAQGDVIGSSVSLSTHLHPVVGVITLIPIPLG